MVTSRTMIILWCQPGGMRRRSVMPKEVFVRPSAMDWMFWCTRAHTTFSSLAKIDTMYVTMICVTRTATYPAAITQSSGHSRRKPERENRL